MSMSYKKFTSKGKKQYAMDLTPMIDVVFLLLIFFMVATNFNKFSSMNINIPKSSVKNQTQEIDEIKAGHIWAVIGLKDTKTWDTLCDLNDKFLVESMEFPEPVISISVEPKTKADQEKM